MPISDCWNFSLIFKSNELKLSQTKVPDVIKPVAFVFTSKNIQISVISSKSTTSSRTRNIYIIQTLPIFLSVVPS